MDDVDLAAAIGVIRAQLIRAQEERDDAELSFAVGKVEIELGGELKWVSGAGGGIKFWVASVDAKGERSSSATHKVKIELLPVDSKGTSWRVASGALKPPAE